MGWLVQPPTRVPLAWIFCWFSQNPPIPWADFRWNEAKLAALGSRIEQSGWIPGKIFFLGGGTKKRVWNMERVEANQNFFCYHVMFGFLVVCLWIFLMIPYFVDSWWIFWRYFSIFWWLCSWYLCLFKDFLSISGVARCSQGAGLFGRRFFYAPFNPLCDELASWEGATPGWLNHLRLGDHMWKKISSSWFMW